MPLTVDWPSAVINVPQSYLTHVGGVRYQLDVGQMRRDLRALEASVEGMPWTPTHFHSTEVTLAGVTFARQVVILAPYTITFEDGQYVVLAVGANHNIVDVLNPNQVSFISQNSAGLIAVSGGITPTDKQDIADLVTADSKTLTVGKFLALK